MDISAFQSLMKDLFFHRDAERGTMKTFAWFIEEVGELASELRKMEALPSTGESKQRLEAEFGDVLAWLCSLANLAGVDIERAAMEKYPGACSKCGKKPCQCSSV